MSKRVVTAKPKRKPSLDPAAMLIAIALIAMGLAAAILGFMNREALGVFWASIVIIGGLSSAGLAITANRTGKVEWILLDLILPN